PISLSRNFMECRVLLTGAELDLFTHLAEPATSRDLADKQGWHERPLTAVLDALAAMGLLIKKDGHYQTDPARPAAHAQALGHHLDQLDELDPHRGRNRWCPKDPGPV
ncbi:MAG: hypothetical protein M0036_23635, partial [Desulfobacteraceae bacterium]|nr:hypothetical protein [Desulfobacteraceae bacterium]